MLSAYSAWRGGGPISISNENKESGKCLSGYFKAYFKSQARRSGKVDEGIQ